MSDEIQLIKLSASSMKTYEQCPRKYYFNYIEKVPTKHWEHFDLGNLCHKTLEIFHKEYMNKTDVDKRSLEQMMGFGFSLARKDFPDMREELLADAKGMLLKYLSLIKKEGVPIVKGVETSFTFNVTDNVLIRGFIDRLDITKDKGYKIVDYKTTKNEKYLDEFQLLIYGLWLRNNYPDVKNFEGSYVLLRHDSKEKKYKFTMEDVDKVEKKIIKYADMIRDEDSWVPIPTRLCNWCDFKEICPAQKNCSW